MSAFRYFACFAGLALACATAAEVHAATPKPRHGIGTALIARLAPAVPCTSKNRMDVFIDEDNIMYECECVWLLTMPDCKWQVIGGVDPVSLRRHLKRHHVTRGRSVWIYSKPSVTA